MLWCALRCVDVGRKHARHCLDASVRALRFFLPLQGGFENYVPARYACEFDTVTPSPFVVSRFSRGFCYRPVRAFYVRSVDGFKVWRLDMRRGAVEGR